MTMGHCFTFAYKIIASCAFRAEKEQFQCTTCNLKLIDLVLQKVKTCGLMVIFVSEEIMLHTVMDKISGVF